MSKNEIAKSSILVQKERELKDLQKQKEKTSKSIQTTKTKIAGLQKGIETASKDMMSAMGQMAKLQAVAKEVLEAYKKLRKKVKLKRQDKEEIDAVLEQIGAEDIVEQADETFSQSPFGSAENFNNGKFGNDFDENEYADEFNRQRRAQMFDPYIVKPTEGEQQQIRRVYLELANRFHPDKAPTAALQKQAHDLMQRINAAYHRGDMAELLDIKKQFPDYAAVETADINTPLLDILDEQILRAKNELNLLDSQLQRLKSELDQLKSSDIGQAVKESQRMRRHMDVPENEAERTDFMVDMLKELTILLNEWQEMGKKPKAFSTMLDGTHPIFERGRELGIISGEDDDDFDFFDDDDDDEDEMTEAEFAEMVGFLNKMAQQNQPTRRGGGKRKY